MFLDSAVLTVSFVSAERRVSKMSSSFFRGFMSFKGDPSPWDILKVKASNSVLIDVDLIDHFFDVKAAILGE